MTNLGNWTLRRAEQRDAEALAACIDAAYAEAALRLPDLPPVSANCAEEIARHQVWLADVAHQLAGALVLSPQADCMLLVNVAVHPDRRGTGLGRALIAHAETEASRQGFHELRLSTHVGMPENLQLYGHLGWQEFARQGNKVSMRKTL